MSAAATKRKRHGVKIREAVLDHIPKPHTWHVIECSCGWSSALHSDKDAVTEAFEAHKRSRRKR